MSSPSDSTTSTFAGSGLGIEAVQDREDEMKLYRAQESDREKGSRLKRSERRFQTLQSGKGWLERAKNRVDWTFAGNENPEQTMSSWEPWDGERRKFAAGAELAEREQARVKGQQRPSGIGFERSSDDDLRGMAGTLRRIELNTRGPTTGAVQGNVGRQGE